MAGGNYIPTTGEYIRSVNYSVMEAQNGLWRLDYKVTGTGGAGRSLQQIADFLDVTTAPLMKALLNPVAAWFGVVVTSLNTKAAFPGYAKANQGPGTLGTYPLPSAVSGLIEKTTSLRGRKYRGRSFIPFPPREYDNAHGSGPNADYVTALIALASTLFTSTITVGSGPDTLTLQGAVTHPTSPPTGDLIVTSFSRTKWGTQHRRGSYGATNQPIPF